MQGLYKRHTGPLGCPGALYLTILPTFPGRVAWWCLWGWFKAVQNLFSGFITEANKNHFCGACGPVGKMAACGTSSLPLARCIPGNVSAWLSMGWARTQPKEERVGQLTKQEPLRSSRGCFEVAVNLLSGHVNCVSPYHLWGTKAVFGFLFLAMLCCESSWPFPCIRHLLSRSHPGYLHIWLSVTVVLWGRSYVMHKPEPLWWPKAD